MSAGEAGAPLTHLQGALLQAAFGKDGSAVTAWRRWRDATDWESHLDQDCFRLLPRTSRNLRRLGDDDPLLPRLAGIARQAWFANQRRAGRMQPMLQALAAAGVDLLLVPPAALLLLEGTAVISPETPLACAVRGRQADAAIGWLRRLGWRAAVRVPRWSLGGYVAAGERLAWQHPEGCALDLLWQRDRGDRTSRFPGEVWDGARRARLAAVSVLTMEASDALHDFCAQPPAGDAFTSIVDLLLLIDALPEPPDWQRVIALAARAPLDPGWRACFAQLRAVMPETLPAAVLEEWPDAGRPAAPPAAGRVSSRLAAQWAVYREALGAEHSAAMAVRQLPGYLLARWNLPGLRRLPLRLLKGLRYEWLEARRRGSRISRRESTG